MLRSFCSAFLMYSRIPVPKVEWNEKNRRYSLCFFPFIGIVVGALLIGWRFICDKLDIGQVLFAVVAAAVPVLVTGGIHLDGYCDVTDAVSSYASKERRLEILSDPRVGAFAVIYLALYLLLQFGFYTEVFTYRTLLIIGIGFILSRALSAMAAITFKSAKKQGTLQSFVKPAHKKFSVVFLSSIIIMCAVGMIILSPVQGISCVMLSGAAMLYYRRSAYKNFGGITGDTEGWFLQICEIGILISAVISGKISEIVNL